MKKLVLSLILTFIVLASLSFASATYNRLIILDTAVKDQITYKETAEFDLEIENPLSQTEEVYIISPITEWSISLSDTQLIIPYKQSRHVSVSLTPPVDIRPGKYISCFTFRGLTHSAVSNHHCIFIIVTEGAPIVEESKEELPVAIDEQIIDKFLSSTHIITLKNEGSATAKGEYTANFELLSSFFVASEPLSSGIRSITEGKQFYWLYALESGESLQISYTVSYFPLIVSIAVVIIALIFLASFYVSGLRIDKQLLIPSKTDHGKKAVKVKLSIKNNTYTEFKDVQIEDYLPTPLTLTEDFGTLEPSVVRKKEDMIKLVWRLPVLAPKEERVLSYAFKSRLEVLGKILLPRARLVYQKGNKKSAIYSGLLVIRGKKEERIE